MSDTNFENMTVDEKLNAINTAMATPIMRLNDAIDRHYTVNHELDAIESLDALYNRIIAVNSELADVSAVGFTAILQNGDSLSVNGNHLFINNTVEQLGDYTFTGTDSYEIINVWYFDGGNETFTLPNFPHNIANQNIKQKDTQINNLESIMHGNIILSGVSTWDVTKTPKIEKITILDSIDNFFNTPCEYSGTANMTRYTEIYSNASSFLGKSGGPIYNNTCLIKATFPNLLTISNSGNSAGFFVGCSNQNLEISFPVLQTIQGGQYSGGTIFASVYRIIIPESVTSITRTCFSNNHYVEIRCVNATIGLDWFVNAPNLLVLPNGLQSDIDLHIAAGKQVTLDWYHELIFDKLYEFTDGTHLITLPTLAQSLLTTAETTELTRKHWTLQYA